MNRMILAFAAVALLAACQKSEPRHFSQAALDKALADPGRKEQCESSDERRKPGPLIALAGVQPGDKVLDLIPGSGYWTKIFSKVVGPEGKVYAIWPQAYAREAMGDVLFQTYVATRRGECEQYEGMTDDEMIRRLRWRY